MWVGAEESQAQVGLALPSLGACDARFTRSSGGDGEKVGDTVQEEELGHLVPVGAPRKGRGRLSFDPL